MRAWCSGGARSGVLVRAGLLLVLALATGCAKAQAKSSPDGPPLQVPQAPPHVIAAAEEPPPPPQEEPPPPAPAPPPRPASPVAVRPPRAEPRPEPPAQAAGNTEKPEPRTLLAPGDATRERALRDRLAAASRDLGRVDYAKLTAGGRSQYDQAKRFLQQADQAIKERNLAFASTLAEKAATLAADLLGR